MKRPAVSHTRRVRIFEESNYCCVYCGELASVLDHVIPFAFGGSTRDDNLVAACVTCNAKASDKVFSSFAEKYLFLKAERANGRSTVAPSIPALPPKKPVEPFVPLKRRARVNTTPPIRYRKSGPDPTILRQMRRERDEADMRALLLEIRGQTP